jgi:predicted small integral membrane protein
MATATRTSQLLLIAAVALLHGLVAFNNVTDYDSNFQFVSHVLRMDTTFRNPSVMWRAIDNVAVHHAAYALIIGWEFLCAALCAVGAVKLYKARRATAAAYAAARAPAMAGLLACVTLWLVGFLIVGGEWFLMWQSDMWNGQDAAFRMFVVVAVALLVLTVPDTDTEQS